MRRFLLLLIVFAAIPLSHALALAPPEALQCERAIVAAETGGLIPARLLEAIGQVESGRPDAAGVLHSWPWTINAEGEGHFYATKAQAIAAARDFQSRGLQSIDVGCMQVNLFHHPTAFSGLDRAFDPYENARYAARFLNILYRQTGSWTQATAAYHSQTPALAQPYQRRVMVQLQRPSSRSVVYGSHFAAFSVRGSAYRSFAPSEQTFAAFAK